MHSYHRRHHNRFLIKIIPNLPTVVLAHLRPLFQLHHIPRLVEKLQICHRQVVVNPKAVVHALNLLLAMLMRQPLVYNTPNTTKLSVSSGGARFIYPPRSSLI